METHQQTAENVERWTKTSVVLMTITKIKNIASYIWFHLLTNNKQDSKENFEWNKSNRFRLFLPEMHAGILSNSKQVNLSALSHNDTVWAVQAGF